MSRPEYKCEVCGTTLTTIRVIGPLGDNGIRDSAMGDCPKCDGITWGKLAPQEKKGDN